MDDLAYGTRNKRGDWTPTRRVTYAPVFVWPPKPAGFLKWLFGFPGYLWPWNFFYAALALAAWRFATPSTATMRTFGVGWIALVLLRNAVLIVAWYGVFHFRLYVQKAQANRFKYNARGLANESEYFTFGSQTKDNMFWTLASGLPMWTAYEVVSLWMFANGHIGWLKWSRNPVWFVVLLVLIPLFREFHFHVVHRAIHWAPMYKYVHSLHHRNTNPGPWSGLSMHPVEHLIYFSGVLIHWVVLSHPVHAMFHLFHAALSPVPGHTGYDKVELGENRAFETNCQAHYLHHKYFEVNYSDGSIPLDKWFGSFHDGSSDGDDAMQARVDRRAAKTKTKAKV
jgi:sterol desaturase/sphingolipid hydroxylase (fatty acid hydroxylase superfamily)